MSLIWVWREEEIPSNKRMNSKQLDAQDLNYEPLPLCERSLFCRALLLDS